MVLMHHWQVILLGFASWETRVLIGRSSSYDWVGLNLLGGVFVCCFAVSEKKTASRIIFCRARNYRESVMIVSLYIAVCLSGYVSRLLSLDEVTLNTCTIFMVVRRLLIDPHTERGGGGKQW